MSHQTRSLARFNVALSKIRVRNQKSLFLLTRVNATNADSAGAKLASAEEINSDDDGMTEGKKGGNVIVRKK